MFSKNKKNKSGMSLPVIIIGITIASAIIASTTSWVLSLNTKVSNIDGRLEAMTVATAEWNRLNAMSMEDLEAQKDTLSDYTVGDYQVMVDLGEKGVMEDGKCKTSGLGTDEELNCYNDSKVVIRKDGETLYSSKLLPLVAGGDGGGGKVPRLDVAKKYYVGCSGYWNWSCGGNVSVSGTTSYVLPKDSYVLFTGTNDSASGTYTLHKDGEYHSYSAVLSPTSNASPIYLGSQYYPKGAVISFGITSRREGGYYSCMWRALSATSGAYIIPVK